MKISITTYPWGKIKTSEQFDRMLALVRQIGFDGIGIEFSLLPSQLMKEPELLPELLSRYDLENGGTFSPCSDYVLKWSKRSETPLMWVATKAPSAREAFSNIRRYAKKSKRDGIIAALHNELRSSFQLQGEITNALDSVPELYLCLDTAHAVGADINMVELIHKYRKRLALVHLKDLREKLPRSQIRFRRDFVNVGDGIVDLKSVVQELHKIKYEGQLMLEIEALAEHNPDDAVKEGFKRVKNLL